jgi:hypothetical protein
VGALEPASRQVRTTVFVVLGVAVATELMHAVVRGPVSAGIEGHHLDYDVHLWQGTALAVLYVLATCGSLLVSDHPHVRAYGLVNLAAVGVLAWVDQSAFVSLWCLWAGVTSVWIDLHLRHAPRTGSRRPRSRVLGHPGAVG